MNPLENVITFLRHIGPYADPDSSLSIQEQISAGADVVFQQLFRCYCALPGVPQDQLERAFVYVERRSEMVPGNGHRARRNREWLGRWSKAFAAELERRERHGDLAAPAVRDGMKLSWVDMERARQEAERWTMLPMPFEQLPPQSQIPIVEIPEIRIGETIFLPPPVNWADGI